MLASKTPEIMILQTEYMGAYTISYLESEGAKVHIFTDRSANMHIDYSSVGLV